MRNKYKGQDTRARLGNTLIRYKDIPVMCSVNEDGSILNLTSISDGSLVAQVSPDDQNIDISSITLGYVNTGFPYNCACYIRRLPRRMYKQGVDLNSLEYRPLSNNHGHIEPSRLFNKDFKDSLCDVFPTFKVAMNTLTKKGYESIALTKEVAIFRSNDILKFFIKGVESGFSRMKTPDQVIIPLDEMTWVNSFILSQVEGLNIIEGNKAGV